MALDYKRLEEYGLIGNLATQAPDSHDVVDGAKQSALI